MFCEHCCKEMTADAASGRPVYFRKEGWREVLVFAVRTVFGTHLCQECFNAIKRNKPRKAPMNTNLKRYVTAVEAGRKNPPFKMSVSRNGVTDHSPIKLSAADLKKCGMER